MSHVVMKISLLCDADIDSLDRGYFGPKLGNLIIPRLGTSISDNPLSLSPAVSEAR